jgi:hypothetical protein
VAGCIALSLGHAPAHGGSDCWRTNNCTTSEWRAILPIEKFVCEKGAGGAVVHVTLDPTSESMTVENVWRKDSYPITSWEVRTHPPMDEFGHGVSTYYWNAFVTEKPRPITGRPGDELLAQTPNTHFSIFRYATGWGFFVGSEMQVYRCVAEF